MRRRTHEAPFYFSENGAEAQRAGYEYGYLCRYHAVYDFIILCIIYGAKPACDGADYTFLEQSFGAVSAVAICASGLMGLPLAVSGLREMKVLKRMRVTPVSPIFILGVEPAMYAVYCAVSLATLSICVMLGVAALSTTLAVRFFRWE